MIIEKTDSIRRIVSRIMGRSIPPGGFYTVLHEEDTQGRFGGKQILDILCALLEKQEEYENEKNLQP